MAGICVFLSSSKYVDTIYFDAARDLAQELHKAGFELVWGGADVGLMGVIADEIQRLGGVIRGVLPKSLLKVGLEYKNADEMIITRDMSVRKNTMNELSSGYIAFPGGIGTLEEILEVITLKQLGYLSKPIVFLNIENYYTTFFTFIEEMIEKKFLKPSGKELYYIATEPADAVEFIKNYTPSQQETKW